MNELVQLAIIIGLGFGIIVNIITFFKLRRIQRNELSRNYTPIIFKSLIFALGFIISFGSLKILWWVIK